MGVFKVLKSETGHVFHLVAANGENIGTSQVYASKENCLIGVESVRTNADAHVEDQTVSGSESLANPKFEIFIDKGKEHFRFHLKAHNGEIILASQAYTSKESCKGGIDSVGVNAPEAAIVEE